MSEDRKQRSDATANRARILQAATIALRESGLSVDMRAIAAVAGVGIGTLYRHFSTREALIQAVTGVDLSALAEARLAEGGTAIEALRVFFLETLTCLVGNKVMIDLLAVSQPSDADLTRCLRHLRDRGQEAIERSATDHSLAADITADVIAYQFLGLIRIVQLLPDAESDVLLHHLDVTIRALAA